jgi:hypothetical protein
MPDTFDARFSTDLSNPLIRFSLNTRELLPQEQSVQTSLVLRATELENLIRSLPPSDARRARYIALAVTALEQSISWAAKALYA